MGAQSEHEDVWARELIKYLINGLGAAARGITDENYFKQRAVFIADHAANLYDKKASKCGWQKIRTNLHDPVGKISHQLYEYQDDDFTDCETVMDFLNSLAMNENEFLDCLPYLHEKEQEIIMDMVEHLSDRIKKQVNTKRGK